MARRRSTEQKLGELHALRERGPEAEVIDALREGLADRSAAVVAKAAGIAADLQAEALVDPIETAFSRLLDGGVKADPGCVGKVALVRALHRFGHPDESVFLAGLYHVQLEPVYGGRRDTAGELRGLCALALAHTPYPEALIEIAERLADPEAQARVGAARAVAALGRPDGSSLLRLALASGEQDPDVVGEYTSALLALTPSRGLGFLERWLPGQSPAVLETGALAVAAAHPPGSLELLRRLYEGAREDDLRGAILLAIALLRGDAAIGFLVSLVADARRADACHALRALGTYRDDDRIALRVREAVARREDVDLGASLRESFGAIDRIGREEQAAYGEQR